jgi:hypothetical protein
MYSISLRYIRVQDFRKTGTGSMEGLRVTRTLREAASKSFQKRNSPEWGLHVQRRRSQK